MNPKKTMSKKKLYAGIGVFLFSALLATGVVANNLRSDNTNPDQKMNQKIESKGKKGTQPKDQQESKEKKDTVKKTYEKYGVTPKTDFPRSSTSASSSLSPRERQSVVRAMNQQKEEKRIAALPVSTPNTTPVSVNNKPDKKPEKPVDPVIPPVVKSKPVIHYQEGIILEKGQLFTPSNYFTVEDSLDKHVQVYVDTTEFNVNEVGSQSFVVVATNKFGEVSVATIPVYVASKPSIQFVSNEVELVIGSDFVPENYVQASDETEGDLTANVRVIHSSVNNEAEGVYSAEYAVTTSYGITTSAILTVRVINQAPTIIAPNSTHEINQAFDPLVGVTAVAFNGESIPVTEENVLENLVDINTEGTYQVTYKVSDQFGKESEIVKREITVENEAPVLHGVKDLEFSVGTKITEQLLLEGVTATDREDNKLGLSLDVKLDPVQLAAIKTDSPGKFPLTYSTIDSMGKETKKEITVTILGEKPVIHGIDDKVIELNQAFDPLTGVTVTDKEDGSIPNSKIEVTGSVDSSTAGDYVLTYQVKDSHGQQSEVYTRKITVKPAEVKVVDTKNSIKDTLLAPLTDSKNKNEGLEPTKETTKLESNHLAEPLFSEVDLDSAKNKQVSEKSEVNANEENMNKNQSDQDTKKGF